MALIEARRTLPGKSPERRARRHGCHALPPGGGVAGVLCARAGEFRRQTSGAS